MAEEITIKIRAETEDAQQNVQEFREELDKTAKSSDKMDKSLGKMTAGADRMNRSWQKMGATLKNRLMPSMGVPTTVQGPMSYGGGMGGGMFGGRMGGMGKLGIAAGLGAIGGSLLGNLLGGAGGKLAGFDKLNAIGQQDLFDFLDPRFKDISKQLGDIGGSLSSLTGSLSSVGGSVININTTVFDGIHATVKAIGTTIGHWFDGLDVGKAVFENILGLSTKINGVTHSWFDGLYDEGDRVFNHILGLAGQVLDTIKGWFDVGGGTVDDGTSKASDSISYTGNNNITQKLVDELKAKIDAGGTSTGSKTLLDKIGDAVGTLASGASTAFNTITSIIGNGITSDLSNTGNLLLDNLANITIGGTATRNAFGSVVGMAGGTSAAAKSTLTAAAKGMGLRPNIARLLGIPGYAEGGVFLPNQPQLAILGDNRSESEVAAPYSMIVQAVGDALRSNGGMTSTAVSGPTTIEVPISLNGKVIARGIYDDLESERRRRNGSAMV